MKPVHTLQNLANGNSVVIVALGDSLTYGWMVRKGYLDYLKDMLKESYPAGNLKLINKGIPGDTAEGGLYRLDHDVLALDPDCVMIQFGLNDAFSGYATNEYRDNVDNMIMRIQAKRPADIVLVTSVCLGSNRENRVIDSYYLQLEELAQKYNLPIAKVHSYWKQKIAESIEFRSLVQLDGVHPTSRGYQLMAEAIMEVLS